jgi:Tfp pilus assembly protein PilN
MIKINLLPHKVRKEVKRKYLYLFLFILLINLLISGGIFFKNEWDIANYKKKIDNTKKEITSLDKIHKEYLALQNEMKELEKKLAVIDKIKEGKAFAARILFDLSSVTKENIWLKNFKKNEDKFEIIGHSMEGESISGFMETIAKIPYVKDVELVKVEDTVEERVVVKKFTLKGIMSYEN